MSQRSGFIAFDEEMSCPGKTVCDQRPGQSIERMSHYEWDHQCRQPHSGANGMKPAVRGIAVLLQVKCEELLVRGKVPDWQSVAPLLQDLASRHRTFITTAMNPLPVP